MAVTITHDQTDEHLLQGFFRAPSWRRSMEASPRCARTTNHEQQTNPELCTTTLTCHKQSLTMCEAPARKPADSLWHSPLRLSPQQPQPAHARAQPRWPVLEPTTSSWIDKNFAKSFP